MAELSPMMQQYVHLKEQYKDCLLFFFFFDFYEMFFEDAQVAFKELELTLTGRDCGLEERAPMCGVPHHAAETYISRLIQKGYKVAIAEQITDPALGGGLVQRDVVRVITPGTVLEESMLDAGKNNYLVSLVMEDGAVGLAYTDISTGEFIVDTISGDNYLDRLMDELARLEPSEMVVNEAFMLASASLEGFHKRVSARMDVINTAMHELRPATALLCEHFQVKDLSPYNLKDKPMTVCAAAALLDYLSRTQKHAMAHIVQMQVQQGRELMALDGTTRYSLEMTKTIRGGSRRG